MPFPKLGQEKTRGYFRNQTVAEVRIELRPTYFPPLRRSPRTFGFLDQGRVPHCARCDSAFHHVSDCPQ